MKIEEAIKGSQEAAFRLEREGFEDWAKSVEVGIEAMKREILRRKDPGFVYLGFLPGETEK